MKRTLDTQTTVGRKEVGELRVCTYIWYKNKYTFLLFINISVIGFARQRMKHEFMNILLIRMNVSHNIELNNIVVFIMRSECEWFSVHYDLLWVRWSWKVAFWQQLTAWGRHSPNQSHARLYTFWFASVFRELNLGNFSPSWILLVYPNVLTQLQLFSSHLNRSEYKKFQPE